MWQKWWCVASEAKLLTHYGIHFHTLGALLLGLLFWDCHAMRKPKLTLWKCYKWEKLGPLTEKATQSHFLDNLLTGSNHQWLQVRLAGEASHQPTGSKEIINHNFKPQNIWMVCYATIDNWKMCPIKTPHRSVRKKAFIKLTTLLTRWLSFLD